MAQAGVGSRRHNETLIRDGRVRVNGRVAQLGDQADAERDTITLDGNVLTGQRMIYIMLNKPRGVLSSTEDELGQGRKTIRDLVDVPGHLYPVGRLDKPSEGLILLTNDGQLAHRLTHPRYEHEKAYRVSVEGEPDEATLRAWREGIDLDGERTAPARVTKVNSENGFTRLHIVLREGRKRQIRRVAAQLGHPVRRLLRVRLGPLQLVGVRPGTWRYLTDDEVRLLRQTVQPQQSKGDSKRRNKRNPSGPRRR
jgi:pseudouridine synthase